MKTLEPELNIDKHIIITFHDPDDYECKNKNYVSVMTGDKLFVCTEVKDPFKISVCDPPEYITVDHDCNCLIQDGRGKKIHLTDAQRDILMETLSGYVKGDNVNRCD